VDNRPGGNGVVAINAFRGAAADGHDLVHLDSSMLTSNLHLYSKLPYDPQKDFEPIRPTLQTDFFVVVGKDSAYKTIDDVLTDARAKPDNLNYGSWGQGSPGHLGALRLQSTTGAKMQHVAYKEMPQLFAAVATGEVQWALGSMASAGPMENQAVSASLVWVPPKPRLITPLHPAWRAQPQPRTLWPTPGSVFSHPRAVPRPFAKKLLPTSPRPWPFPKWPNATKPWATTALT